MQGRSLIFEAMPKSRLGTGVFADSDSSDWDAIYAELERLEHQPNPGGQASAPEVT